MYTYVYMYICSLDTHTHPERIRTYAHSGTRAAWQQRARERGKTAPPKPTVDKVTTDM